MHFLLSLLSFDWLRKLSLKKLTFSYLPIFNCLMAYCNLLYLFPALVKMLRLKEITKCILKSSCEVKRLWCETDGLRSVVSEACFFTQTHVGILPAGQWIAPCILSL